MQLSVIVLYYNKCNFYFEGQIGYVLVCVLKTRSQTQQSSCLCLDKGTYTLEWNGLKYILLKGMLLT